MLSEREHCRRTLEEMEENDMARKREKPRPKVDWLQLRDTGGLWLGACRNWMQNHKLNGSDVRWGSDEVLRPGVTVREMEEMAAQVAAAAIQAERERVALRHEAL